jgi:flavin reductase
MAAATGAQQHHGESSVTGAAAARIDDARLFRDVMSRFATGITVVTTTTADGHAGMTANAFMAGSLRPPLCVISIGHGARMHEKLRESGRFGVSILGEDQQHLSNHFAGRPLPGLHPEFAYLGETPVVARALAALSAEIVASYPCGDHTLFVGRIEQMEAGTRLPLLFYGSRYAAIDRTARIEDSEPPGFW